VNVTVHETQVADFNPNRKAATKGGSMISDFGIALGPNPQFNRHDPDCC